MRTRTPRWTAAASFALALACSDQSVTGPNSSPGATPPRYSAAESEDPFAALLAPADLLLLAPDMIGTPHDDQSAHGYGSVTFEKTRYSFAFTAVGDDDPKTTDAKGQFEYKFEGDNTSLRLHGEVTCLAAVKPLRPSRTLGVAFIGGRVTHSDSRDVKVGTHVAFEAHDEGEGESNSQDRLSKLVIPKDGLNELEKMCLTPPFYDATQIEIGNIQVPWVSK